MASYKTTSEAPRRDNYWRIYDGKSRLKHNHLCKLTDAGYKVNDKTSIEELRALQQHHDRGGLCYGQCSDDEVQKFMSDRNIHVKKATKRTWRSQTIKALMAADANAHFDRFHQLPPELRTRIYGMHFAEICPPERTLSEPSQPPITRANRLLRAEALPLFYATARLTIAFTRRQSSFVRFGLSDTTIRSLSNASIGGLRQFDLAVSSSFGERYFTLRVEFDGAAMAFTAAALPGSSREDLAVAGLKALTPLLDGVVGREGMRKLKRKDFDDVGGALSVALMGARL